MGTWHDPEKDKWIQQQLEKEKLDNQKKMRDALVEQERKSYLAELDKKKYKDPKYKQTLIKANETALAKKYPANKPLSSVYEKEAQSALANKQKELMSSAIKQHQIDEYLNNSKSGAKYIQNKFKNDPKKAKVLIDREVAGIKSKEFSDEDITQFNKGVVNKSIKPSGSSAAMMKQAGSQTVQRAVENASRTRELEQKYYKEVFAPKQKQMINNLVASNPNMKLKTTKGKDGILKYEVTNSKNGQKYEFLDPSTVPPGKGQNHRFYAVRTMTALQEAATGKKFSPQPAGYEAKANHGGGGFFGSIGGALGGTIGKAFDFAKTFAQPTETFLKSAVKQTGNIAKSAVKGDVKGVAGGALGAVEAAKKAAIGQNKALLGAATDVAGTAGKAVGSKDITQAASNVKKEYGKGADTYGGTAIDVAANAFTGGGYGLAKAGTQALANDGVGGLLDSDTLKQGAVSAAASYAGVDPNVANIAQGFAGGDIKKGLADTVANQLGIDPAIAQGIASGDIKGAALAQLAGKFGIDPKMLGSVASGDVSKLGADLFSSYSGLDSGLAQGLVKGDVKGAGVDFLADQAGIDQGIARGIAGGKSPEDIGKEQAIKYGRGVVSGYTDDLGDNMNLNELFTSEDTKEKLKNLPYWETAEGVLEGKAAAAKKLIKDSGVVNMDAFKSIPGLQSTVEGRGAQVTSQAPESTWYGDLWEGTKNVAGKIGGGVAGAASAAGNFIGNNPNLAKGALDAGAAYMGYKEGQEALEDQKGYLKDSLAQSQNVGKELMGIKYDPNRYKQEQQFYQDRIKGKGFTAEERKIQQEGDLRAAQSAAAQRRAGMEQQSRLGGAGMGTASLAASLSGAQGAQNIQSQANLEREASAQQKMEQALGMQGKLSSQEVQERSQLAGMKAETEFGKSDRAANVRAGLGDLEAQKGAAQAGLWAQGANLASQGVNYLAGQQPTPQPQVQTKANAAQQVVNKQVQKPAVVAPKQSAAESFNQAYTIKSGDSLSKIAAQRGMSLQQLMAANPQIKDPNKIAAGAALNIPGAQKAVGQVQKAQQTANQVKQVVANPKQAVANVANKAVNDVKNKAVSAGTNLIEGLWS